MRRLISNVLDTKKTHVLETKGAVIELHEKHIRYRERSRVERLNPSTELWEECLWDEEMICPKDAIGSVHYYFDNDTGIYQVQITMGGKAVNLDFADQAGAAEHMEQIGAWLNR